MPESGSTQILETTVREGQSGLFRIQIALADEESLEASRESISVSVDVEETRYPRPSLAVLQLAALDRAVDLLREHTRRISSAIDRDRAV